MLSSGESFKAALKSSMASCGLLRRQRAMPIAEGGDLRWDGKGAGRECFGQQPLGFLILAAQKCRAPVGRLQRSFLLLAERESPSADDACDDEEQYSEEPRRWREFPHARRSTQTPHTRRRRRHRTRTLT